MFKIVRFLLLILAVAILSCTNDKPIPGAYEILQRGNKGDVVVTELRPEKTAIYWQTPQIGRTPNLLLGAYGDVSSVVLLRFLVFSPVDTPSVESAIIHLRQNHHFGEGDSFQVNVYPVTAEWVETEVKWSDIENGYDTSDLLASFYVSPTDSDVVDFEIPASLVNTWISQEDNSGIILTFEQASFMVNFISSDDFLNGGTMDLIYHPKSGGTDTTFVNVIHDASLPVFQSDIEENTLVENPERLRIGNLSGYRALLRFDLSQLPPFATIHQAYLTFYIDQDKSAADSAGVKVAVTALKDSSWNPPDIVLDSEYQDPVAIAVSDNATLEFSSLTALQSMTGMFQRWMLEQQPNYGLQLRSTEFGYDVSEMYFYSGADDSTKAPVLRITYSIPPTSKFDSP